MTIESRNERRTRWNRNIAVMALAMSVTQTASAQGAQPLGAQLAVLFTSIGSGSAALPGTGIEAQLRFNKLYRKDQVGIVSLGFGGQLTTHKDTINNIKITGVFLEPRFAPAVNLGRVFPYASGRLSYLRQTSNFGSGSGGLGYGVGGGFGLTLSRSVNLDAGVAIIRQEFGEFKLNTNNGVVPGRFAPFTTYAAKIGVSWGFPSKARAPSNTRN